MSPIDDSIREELSALLDGALPEARAAELRRRLERDEALRREYESLRRAVDAVRALPRAAAPSDLRVRIDAAITGRPPRSAIFRFGMLAAAATVVLAAGLVYFLHREEPRTYEAKDVAREAPVKDAREKAQRRDASEAAGSGEPADELVLREEAEPAELRAPAPPAEEGAAKRSQAEGLDKESLDRPHTVVRALEEADDGAASGAAEPPAAPASPAAEAEAEDAVKKRTAEGTPGKSKLESAAEPGTGAKGSEPDLLRVVERQRELATGDRALYLRLLGTLEPAQARQHILAVFATDAAVRESLEGGRGAEAKSRDRTSRTPPLLTSVTLADRDEANLVTRILGATPVPETETASAGALFGAVATDQVATTIEGTPDELRRIRSWLELVDLDRAAEPAPDPLAPDSAAKAKALPKKVRAVVRFRYPPPAEVAKPTAPAPTGK